MGCCGQRTPTAKPSFPPLTAPEAVAKAKSAGKVAAAFQTVESRISICRRCPKFSADVCHKCGCVLVLKIGKQIESCPLQKW